MRFRVNRKTQRIKLGERWNIIRKRHFRILIPLDERDRLIKGFYTNAEFLELEWRVHNSNNNNNTSNHLEIRGIIVVVLYKHLNNVLFIYTSKMGATNTTKMIIAIWRKCSKCLFNTDEGAVIHYCLSGNV